MQQVNFCAVWYSAVQLTVPDLDILNANFKYFKYVNVPHDYGRGPSTNSAVQLAVPDLNTFNTLNLNVLHDCGSGAHCLKSNAHTVQLQQCGCFPVCADCGDCNQDHAADCGAHWDHGWGWTVRGCTRHFAYACWMCLPCPDCQLVWSVSEWGCILTLAHVEHPGDNLRPVCRKRQWHTKNRRTLHESQQQLAEWAIGTDHWSLQQWVRNVFLPAELFNFFHMWLLRQLSNWCKIYMAESATSQNIKAGKSCVASRGM